MSYEAESANDEVVTESVPVGKWKNCHELGTADIDEFFY